jgi:hypothetical protein
MLALLAQEAPIKYECLNRTIAEQWKRKVLDVFSSTISRKHAEEEYVIERNEVIVREFDALIAGLAQYETDWVI